MGSPTQLCCDGESEEVMVHHFASQNNLNESFPNDESLGGHKGISVRVSLFRPPIYNTY